ncbi:MAG: hypothetical protein CL600_12715 [Alteromonas sp.]|nr:hypothetical protein [Alteromonas sp.]
MYFFIFISTCSFTFANSEKDISLAKSIANFAYNKLLKFATKDAAGQLLAGFANSTRNCPLAGR